MIKNLKSIFCKIKGIKQTICCMCLVLFVISLMPAVCIGAEITSPEENVANQEFLRQQEREQFLRKQQEQTPDVMGLQKPVKIPTDLGRLPINETPSFTINEILLVGEMSEEFQWALAAVDRADNGTKDPALNRRLGARGINLIMKRIQMLL